MPLTALIAEDEPLLAQALAAELARAWPALQLLPPAIDGDDAVERALADTPTLLFLDIRMPGRTGLEAAQAIVEDWPANKPLPLIVFVTAYDQYALQAFEASAVDYVLKPVQPARLLATCERLQALLAQREPAAADAAATSSDEALLARLRGLLGGTETPAAAPLQLIQVGVGSSIHMVPIDEVVYFEAADKYVRVLTATHEHLIRMSLRELLPQLDTQRFWQVHRGTVVRASAISQAQRDEAGRLHLLLRGRPEQLIVSRLYAPRFKSM
ncbi:LytTR family DNA-binding domain-containing protein [Ideonella azotifigens]|uniref:LytTR family DNA-binding domain-containing protein n=2 Tax=Ideonella azotifigens TaxID=513160 RepID=A0ABN1JHP4_9BURK|nr:LytTR family DNA-binding domain-containing protein [Ideonella azotifigens]MCD2343599.1 LytTR family DNA-binding domain-containing protein [Ideonella azotifigens]